MSGATSACGAGVDEALARHIAHLSIRDPLVIYKERIEIDDEKDVDHFENIQSTNWNSVRWKPPPDDNFGWREFDPWAGLTVFENAAYTVIIALISRVILFFDLNLYIPMSQVDENMSRAHLEKAASQQRFFSAQLGTLVRGVWRHCFLLCVRRRQ